MNTPFDSANLLEQLPVGIVAVDRAGVVHQVNVTAERLLGRPRRQLLGSSLQRLLPGHPVALDLIGRAQELAAPCRAREARLNPAPGVQHQVSLTAVPVLDAGGAVMGALLQLEETGAAEQLAEGERMHATIDSLSSLALAVAHEVKNPLSGIRGAAQLLELELEGENALECTRLIRSEVDRVSRLLDSLLGLADSPVEGGGGLNIHEVLDHVVALSARAGYEPVRDYDPSLPLVWGDRDRLIQLFLNLVRNAVEAVAGAGSVRLATRISPQVRLEGGRRNLSVMVEVRDDGPGIPPELLKRIFMPFVTTKPGGTGLGLAICQKIAHEHGGLVEVESGPGGTAFRVHLPAARRRP